MDDKPKVIMEDYKPPIPDKPKVDPPKADLVSLVIVGDADGGKARRWMTGQVPGLKGGYDFKPCCPTDVLPEDAKVLLAGGPATGGRLFARADSPEGKAALAGAAPKARW